MAFSHIFNLHICSYQIIVPESGRKLYKTKQTLLSAISFYTVLGCPSQNCSVLLSESVGFCKRMSLRELQRLLQLSSGMLDFKG